MRHEHHNIYKTMKIENQLDKKFVGNYIGNTKSSFANYGCFLFALTYLYSKLKKKQISPVEVNRILLKAGAYNKDMIISEKAAKALGLEYLGKKTDINYPAYFPCIKEVDYSIKDGKQQHFVIRESIDGQRVILDPLGGTTREINYYETKVNDKEWKSGHFSYRLFKLPTKLEEYKPIVKTPDNSESTAPLEMINSSSPQEPTIVSESTSNTQVPVSPEVNASTLGMPKNEVPVMTYQATTGTVDTFSSEVLIKEEIKLKFNNMFNGRKTYLGLAIALLGVFGAGSLIAPDEMEKTVNLIMELAGIAFAVYGRHKADTIF